MANISTIKSLQNVLQLHVAQQSLWNDAAETLIEEVEAGHWSLNDEGVCADNMFALIQMQTHVKN